MTVIERFGGCRHGRNAEADKRKEPLEYPLRVVREKGKSGINTVTEVLSSRKYAYTGYRYRKFN
ncbi:MAG: hypothetical protein IJH32_10660 [Ruminococcus sp.]|nr:hypothetical protein [Ruminococcus sp.]